MAYRVLIAGAGQLGSRYLQGLASVLDPLDIWVLDISTHALKQAQNRWNDVSRTCSHIVNYSDSLKLIPNNFDVAIIATTADSRVSVIQNILEQSFVKNWILEKVLAQCEADIIKLQLLLKNNHNVWVNTPMYLWPLYQNIRQLYSNTSPICASFEGFRGLACNAIHYIDFVSRWNGADVIHIDVSGLLPQWYPAKRDGFYEVDGSIIVNFSDQSSLKLSSYHNSINYQVKLKVDYDEWSISESEGRAVATSGQMVVGDIKLQSQLTGPMVVNILNNRSCGLPTLSESAQQHKVFLNALLQHWNQHIPQKIDRLPVT